MCLRASLVIWAVAVTIFLASCGGREDSVSSRSVTALQNQTWRTSFMLSQNNMPMGMVTSAISSDIATTVSGDTVVVWNQYNVSEFDIFFSWFRPGSGWSTPIKINSRPGNAFAPRIKTDANGNAMVIWATDQYDMGIRQFKADSGWQSEYFLPHYC